MLLTVIEINLMIVMRLGVEEEERSFQKAAGTRSTVLCELHQK
jgi:hypothetical protein